MKKTAHIDRVRFAAALSNWMREHHLSQREAAERLSVSQAQVSSWVNADKTPSPTSAARVLPVIGGKPADVEPLPDNAPDAAAIADRVVLIPRESVGAAGRVVPYGDDEHESDPYPADELRRLLGFDPRVLITAVVVGDSIKNIVGPGTRVMYAPTQEMSDHGLYILDLDGARLVKLVQRFGGGVLALIPANDRYETETFTPCRDADTPNTYRSETTGETATLCVVGKVVWYPKLA